MSKELIQVSTTFPNQKEADKLSKNLLKTKLAACIQILGPTISHYWWEGRIEKSNEFLVFIKTTKENFDKVQEQIKKTNSYELPEIIATPVVEGDKDYLEWFRQNTK